MALDEKLQTLIRTINDATAEAAITTLFETSPGLRDMYIRLIDGQDGVPVLKAFQFVSNPNDGEATYRSDSIYIGLGRVNDSSNPYLLSQARLADLLGHEGQHGLNQPMRLAGLAAADSIIDHIAQSDGPHDYTGALVARQSVELTNEGIAQIQGWNIAVERAMAVKGDTLTPGEIRLLVNSTRNISFFNDDGAPDSRFTQDPAAPGKILRDNLGNVHYAAEQFENFATSNGSNGLRVLYPAYYIGKQLARIGQIESARGEGAGTFSVDYRALRLDINPATGTPFASSFETNQYMVRAGLLNRDAAGAAISIRNAADATTTDFTFGDTEIKLAVRSASDPNRTEYTVLETAATDGKSPVNFSRSLEQTVSGDVVSGAWRKADGSYGNDIYDWSTGASSGLAADADGTYSTYANDGAGNIDFSFFDAQSNRIGGECRVVSSAADETFTADATSPSATLNYMVGAFESVRDEELSAHVIQSFVGTERPIPVIHAEDVPAGDAVDFVVTEISGGDDAESGAEPSFIATVDEITQKEDAPTIGNGGFSFGDTGTGVLDWTWQCTRLASIPMQRRL